MDKDSHPRLSLFLLVHALAFFASGLTVPAVSIGVRALQGSAFLVGMAFSGVSLARALVLSWSGHLLDRIARPRWFLIGGALVGSVSGIWMARADVAWMMVAGRLLQGLGMAFYLPAMYVFVVYSGPERTETRRLSLLNMAFFLGFSAGPGLGGILLERWGWRAPFWAMAGILLLVAGGLFLGVPDRTVAGARRSRSFLASLALVLRDPFVLGLFLLRLGIAFGRGVVMAFLPLLGLARGLSGAEVGGTITLQLVLMTLFQYPVGALIDRFRKEVFWIAVGNTMMVLGLLGFLLAQGTSGFLLASLVTGLGGGLAIPGALALMAQRGKQLGLASTVSVLESAFAIGFASGPLVGGTLAELWGVEGAFRAALGMGVLGLGGFALALSRSRRA